MFSDEEPPQESGRQRSMDPARVPLTLDRSSRVAPPEVGRGRDSLPIRRGTARGPRNRTVMGHTDKATRAGGICLQYGSPRAPCSTPPRGAQNANMALSVRVVSWRPPPCQICQDVPCHAMPGRYSVRTHAYSTVPPKYCIDRASRKGCQGGGAATHKHPRT